MRVTINNKMITIELIKKLFLKASSFWQFEATHNCV